VGEGPLLPESQQHILQQKFRVDLRLMHRLPFVSVRSLYTTTKEHALDVYVEHHTQKRLSSIKTTDFGRSSLYNDIFFWDNFYKRAKDHIG
jgi:hypothetical protein